MYRHVGLMTAAVLIAVPLLAQAQQQYQQQPPAPQQRPMTFPDKFAAANTTNDGCLTRRQAKRGGLPGVARAFPQIDVERHGCVTMDEIRAYRQSQNAQAPEQPPAPAAPPAPPAGPPPSSY
jgi:hypothetical protein